MALIFSSDFDSLPAEPASRWIKLRDLVEQRLDDKMLSQEGSSDEDLIEYYSILSSATAELAMGELPIVFPSEIRQHFASFRAEVIALATRLSLRTSTSNKAFSVALIRPTKARIASQIERLRKIISESELPENRKKRLTKKLDELEELVRAPRTDFAKVMAVLSYLAAGLGGTTAFLAAAPDALVTISALIGQDKEAEEQQLLEAEQRPLGLPDLRPRISDSDEIPF